MNYVCYKSFEDHAVIKGDTFIISGKFIIKDNKVICRTDSQQGIDHFAYNGDGNGLERGYLLSEIYNRKVEVPSEVDEPVIEDNEIVGYTKKTVTGYAQFNATEKDYLIDHYAEYFDFDNNDFGMSAAIYVADMEDLRKIAAYLNVKSEAEKFSDQINTVKGNITDVEVAIVENYELTAESLTDIELALTEIYEQLSSSAVDYTE